MEQSKVAVAFTFEDCGVDHEQYFRGVGTLPENTWEEVFLGVGDSPREAAQDALESFYSSGWSMSDALGTLVDEEALALSDVSEIPEPEEGDEDSEIASGEVHHYVALYVRSDEFERERVEDLTRAVVGTLKDSHSFGHCAAVQNLAGFILAAHADESPRANELLDLSDSLAASMRQKGA